MKKLLVSMILVSSLLAGCASKPSRASDLYNGCIFVVENGDITTYGVYVEVKERVTDYSVNNLRTYDETIVSDVRKYAADETKIYYRTESVYKSCHKEGYGEKSYFAAATRALYNVPDDVLTKLVSRLETSEISVKLDDSATGDTYSFSTVMPVVTITEGTGTGE